MNLVLFASSFVGVCIVGFLYRVVNSVVWATKAIFFGGGKIGSLYEEIFIAFVSYLATLLLPHQVGYKVQIVLYFVIVIGALAFSAKPSRLLVIISFGGFVLMIFGQDLLNLFSLGQYALLSVDLAPWPLYVWLIFMSRAEFVADLRLARKKADELVNRMVPLITGFFHKLRPKGHLAEAFASVE
jgi:hypothetical protein